MSRVLWIGDGASHTGFARVTHSIGERLVSTHGHDVHVLATNYDGDHWDTNLKLYRPNKIVQMDMFGQSRFVELLGAVEPDVVVILQDPYPILKFLFRNNWDEQKILLQYRPLIIYTPIDGINQPTTWDVLKQVTEPILMAKWGRVWAPDAQVVWHGVETDVFKPLREQARTSSGGLLVRSKREAKKALGYDPDGFLVVRVDRNSGRKDYASTWKALVPVMKKHKDIQVHFHCKSSGDEGVELPQLFSREPEVGDRFWFPGDHDSKIGWTQEDLIILYNAADLFVSTSWGEGFGLTLAEAAACEVPIIAQNVSSITEVVGPGGVLLEPKGTITVSAGHDQWLPDVDAFSEAIERLYLSSIERKRLGKAGREHVKQFSWDFAAARFSETIERLAK